MTPPLCAPTPRSLPALAEAGADLRTLADLGYEGESATITVAFQKPKSGKLSGVQQQSTRSTTVYGQSANGVTRC
jgi:hypothetical protein